MTPLFDWAKRHGVSLVALHDLQNNVLGFNESVPQSVSGVSETAIQQEIRITASQQGKRLWRNNCGVTFRDDGTPIRFGLANDSPKMHDKLRSSDLIGITPVRIKAEHVGCLFGLFTSWEIKRPGWKYNPNDKHSECQNRWNKLIVSMGGDGRFITSKEQIK